MEQIVLSAPAARWGEAFPLGNGHVGAMVYGGAACERIDVTENTFYSGSYSPRHDTPGAAAAFYRMREQLIHEDFAAAHESAEAFIGSRENYGTHLPTGTLFVAILGDGMCDEDGTSGMDSGADASAITQVRLCDGAIAAAPIPPAADTAYRRWLDLPSGTAYSESAGVYGTLRRRTWVSHPAKVLVHETLCDKPFSARVHWESHCAGGSGSAEVCAGEGGSGGSSDNDNTAIPAATNGTANHNTQRPTANAILLWETRAAETLHCAQPVGVNLSGCACVCTDGCVRIDGDALCVENATTLRIFLAMQTDFDAPDSTQAQRSAAALHTAENAAQQDIAQLWQAHADDVRALLGRCTLRLGAAANATAAPAAAAAAPAASAQTAATPHKAEASLALFTLQFQYGRYLLLCASREDSKLPAHLQGIWNDNVACRIGWTCDMHLDINTQMNYWPADVTALPETAAPLLRWVTGPLVEHGSVSAQNNYNLPGWVAEIVSNAWAFTAPYWAVPIAPCPTGGVWILTHLWEHYLITQDAAFLRDEAFPAIESAARFFAGYVFLQPDGAYSCGPSISPENSFLADGARYYLSNGCTYEILMIRELFTQYLAACSVLGQTDGALYAQVETLLPRLLPYRVLADGTLAEWAHDYPSADPQHRHTSHLLGLFPFAQITPEQTPVLAKAAQTTLRQKQRPPEGWEDTGWARSLLMLYAARLHDGDEAWRHLQAMLTHLREPNGMIIHPPTRGAPSFDNVYELDGNTGLTACVAEMLLQSHGGCVRLLPALPTAWSEGAVRGLCARGGVTVDLDWQRGRCTNAVFTARQNTVLRVTCGGRDYTVPLTANAATAWQPD